MKPQVSGPTPEELVHPANVQKVKNPFSDTRIARTARDVLPLPGRRYLELADLALGLKKPEKKRHKNRFGKSFDSSEAQHK